MEAAGLLIKTRSQSDRRATIIKLSDKGLEITLANREKHHAQKEALLSCFTDEEKQTLEKLFTKWLKYLEES